MAATERRNEGIESGSESAEVKFLDKHNASGDSRGEYGYGLRLASQPATVALASPPFPPFSSSCSFSSGLLSYFFFSRHSPLTRFHSCVSKKRTFAVVCVRTKETSQCYFSAIVFVYMRAHPFLAWECVEEEKKRGGRTRTGWDGSLRGTMHRPRLLLFCKMSCRITPDNDIANWSVCRFSLDSFYFFLSTSSVDRITPIMVTFDTVEKGRNFEITLHIYHTLNDPWIFELEERVLLVGITFSKNEHAKYGIEMTRSESHLQTVQHRHRGCHFVKSSKRCDTTTCTRWIQKLVFDKLFLKWISTKRSNTVLHTT